MLAYPGRIFKGKVSYVTPAIDPTTHRLPVRADVENPDGAPKPGMFANFSIITGEAAPAPAVPHGAIVYEGDRARVWVTGEGDTLALREIRTGRISDGMVEVRGRGATRLCPHLYAAVFLISVR
jgi:cobalt-zinc-cadmium efflux system membrane fusion protein